MASTHSLDYEQSFSLDPDGTAVGDENKKTAIVLSDSDSISVILLKMDSKMCCRLPLDIL